tara:strand:+ start:215 stop:958 length:744 start_codon:yes stop_codon:yes gene_type:complete
MLSGDLLAGTFLKTPHHVMIEVLAQSKLDFLCLDAEHAPFDRSTLDSCLAVANALDFPILIRVGDSSHREILQALDYGAVGIVAPHIDTAEKAKDLARAARFGLNGRGYAGSSRWADYGTQKMSDLLEKSKKETVVIAQIEEPRGVDEAEAIAAVDGIDGVFIGPADLSVGYGKTDQNSQDLQDALQHVSTVAHKAQKAAMSFVPNAQKAQDWHKAYGLTMFFIASEHSWLRNGANQDAKGVHNIYR